MGKGKHVTKQFVDRVWTLHKNGIRNKIIADVMNCSDSTVQRIITVMTAAEKNDIQAVYGAYEGYYGLKKIAFEHFGLLDQKQKNDESNQQKTTQTTIEPTNPAILEKIYKILESNNRLLASIATELGINK